MPQQAVAKPFAIPQRLPLITLLSNRANTLTKDAKLINCYAERDMVEGEYWIIKRVGLKNSNYAAFGQGVGMYYSTVANALFYIDNNGVHQSTNGITSSVIGTPTLNGGMIRFEEVLNGTVTTYIVFGDGTRAYYIPFGTTDNVIQITDVNFPTPFCKGFVFLDGTLYVMTPNGNIFGSKNLNDPTAWDPANVIVANSYADNGVCLVRQSDYVVALKQWSVQLFYDAGNAVASPLAKVPGGTFNWGCLSADSVADIDGQLFWATLNKVSSIQIVTMLNLQIKVVSTPSVEKLLGNIAGTVGIKSFCFKKAGHRFYVITIIGLVLTLVYDIDQELWYIWTGASANSIWPIAASAVDSIGRYVMQPTGFAAEPNIYYTEDCFQYPNDAGTLIPVDIYTPNYDGGIDRKKTLSMMRFNADQTNGSTLQVRHSSDDYQTWSNFRSVDLSVQRPFLDNCGTFRRRAYNFRHLANTPFRIKSTDLQIALGAS